MNAHAIPAKPEKLSLLSFRSRLLRTVAPTALIWMVSMSEVWAACIPAAPTDGATVSCTGVPILLPPNPNSFLSNANNLDVTVQAGAIMSTLPGGTAMTLGGTGLTLNNFGAIDANAAGSLVTARALAVGNLVAPLTSDVVINNQGSIEGTFDGTYGLLGAALMVANGGTTTISNSGSIGIAALGLFDPVGSIAVGVYGGGNVNFINTGTITGRVSFSSPNSGGNTFVNAGTINGSVALGTTLASDVFVAVTGSSIALPPVSSPEVTIPTPSVPPSFLTFAETGTVDAGIGGVDTLVLQNTVAGPGSGSGGTGSILALQYRNFENLTVNSGTWTLNGAVASGSATLNGGLTIFDSALTFGTGPITGNGGAVQASVGGLTLAQAINLTGGLIVQGPNALTLGGSISGGGGLIKSGSGVLTLAANNNFSGGLALNGGGLTLGAANSLGTGLFLVGGPATLNTPFSGGLSNQVQLNGALTLDGAGTLTLNGNINGAGSLILGSGTLALTGNNNYSGGTVLQAGSLDLGNSGVLGTGVLTVNGAASLTGASGVTHANSVVLNNTLNFGAGGGGGALTLNGTISGAGGISLAGAPGLTVNGANNFSGGFNLGGGVLTVGNNLALGTGAVTVSGASTLDANADVSLANNFSLNAGLVIGGSNDLTLNGALGGLGSITKHGAATLTLGGANAFAGGVNLLDGELAVGTSTSLGPGALTVNGAAALNAKAGVNLGNAVVLNADLAIIGANNIALGGLVSGAGGLSFDGGATLALNGANTFVGGVRLDSGTLSVGNNLALGTAELTVGGSSNLTAGVPGIAFDNAMILGAGVTLGLNGTNTLALNGTISGAGRLSINNVGTIALEGANTFVGGVILSAGNLLLATDTSLGSGALDVSGNASLSSAGAALNLNNTISLGAAVALSVGAAADLGLSGPIAGGGALLKTGTGKVTLTGTNTYAGGTTISTGTLQIGDGGASGSVDGDIVNDGILVVDRSGNVDLDGAISGGGALVKTGAGTLILSGVNTYSGATTISAGTLQVAGSLGNTAVTVNNGATLGGTGSITGDVTVQDGGTFSPGASAGTLTLGSLTLSGGSMLGYELGTPNVVGGGVNDLTVVTGDLVLDGTLNITDIGGFGPGVYRLMTYGGALTDNVLELGTLPAGVNTGDLLIQTVTAGQVNLVSSAGAVLNFWDSGNAALHDNGVIEGGSGIWDSANRNWTQADGTLNGLWDQDFAIFGGAAGTVTVDNSAGTVLFAGMQFMTDGYVVDGDALTTNTAETIIRVDTGVTAEIGAAITGSGGLVKQDAGTLVLTGTNSYVGGTSVRNGTLMVSADANLGASSGNLTLDGGTLQNSAGFTTARNVTLNRGGGTLRTDAPLIASGVISGAGTLTKTGTGTLTLTGANTYAGGTIINEGSLSLGTAANTAAIVGAVSVSNGDLVVFNADTSAMTSVTVGNSAGLIFEGANTASSISITIGDFAAALFLKQSTAGSATVINTGSSTADGNGTSFMDDSSAGNATVITDHAQVDFVDNATAANANITTNTDGLVRFLGASSGGDARFATNAGGRFDISQLASTGTTAGSIAGAGRYFLGGKTLTVGSNNLSTEVAGVISDGGLGGGTGGKLAKVGTGTLTLSGANSYTGGTAINAGTLQLGGGGTTGSIAGDVEVSADGTLAFNRSNDLTFAGLIGGAGTVEKLAANRLTLTGNSKSFTGTTTVNAGKFAVDGTLGGTLDVLSGGRLEGTGMVGTTTVAAGGTIAPGNSIGTLTVAGDYIQRAGSTYEAEIAPDGTSDLIDVTGAASIEGGTVFALKAPGGYEIGTRYTILAADGGVSGTYGTLDQNAPFVDLTLAYDPEAIYLDVARNDVSFCDVAITANQCAVGNGVNSQGVGTAIYDAIAGLPNAETARDAFDQLSGEMHVSLKDAMLEESRFVREAATDRIRAAFGTVAGASLPVMGYGPEDALVREGKGASVFSPDSSSTDRFAVWARGFGSWGNWDGDGNAAGLDRSIGGLLIGADGFVTETWRLGVVAGYSHSSFNMDERAASGNSDNYHLGLYGGTQWGALGFRAGGAYTWHGLETARSVAFPGFTDQLSADYDAGTTQVFGELGYNFDRGNFTFEPLANLAYVNVHTDGFSETGGAAALSSQSSDTDATVTTLGLRASTDFSIGAIQATANGMVGWRHVFGDVTPTSSFAFAGSDAFAIAGLPIAEDSLVLEAGLDFDLSQSSSLGVSYSGQMASNAGDHGFRADFTVKF